MVNGILIVGGYGHVGSRIASRLIAAGVVVRVAGRSWAKARDMGERLGCDWVKMDMDDPTGWQAALSGMGTAIMCIDQQDADFPALVLGGGGRYIDISASDAVLRRIEALDAPEGLAVLSVGLAPGLTNLMVRAVTNGVDQIGPVTIGVLLGLGDEHGAAAIDWTLETLRPLTSDAIAPLDFGHPPRPVLTIPFDFADQHTLRRRHGLRVTTRLGLGSALITRYSLRLLATMAGSTLLRRVLRESMLRFRFGSDRTALVVEAGGRRMTLEGRAEAEITALMAAQVALMVQGDPRRGVWHIDDLWPLDRFIQPLLAEGITIA